MNDTSVPPPDADNPFPFPVTKVFANRIDPPPNEDIPIVLFEILQRITPSDELAATDPVVFALATESEIFAFVLLLRLNPVAFPVSRELLTSSNIVPPVMKELIPVPELLRIVVLSTETFTMPDVVSSEIPCCVIPSITISSTSTELAASTRMPLMPVPAPLIEMPRILNAFFVSVAAVMLTVTPFVPADRIEPCVSSQSIVTDFVTVTAP